MKNDKPSKKPIVSILRSSNDDYLAPLIDPDAAELSERAVFSNPVASANDCTGITVTVTEKAYEARSIADLANIPVSARNESGEEKQMPPRTDIKSAQ